MYTTVIEAVGLLALGLAAGALPHYFRDSVSGGDVDRVRRYAEAVKDLLTWCGYDHPEAFVIAKHLEALGEGLGVNSGTPVGEEPCTVVGLRTQLDRIKQQQRKEYRDYLLKQGRGPFPIEEITIMDTEPDEEVVTLRMTAEQKETLEKIALNSDSSVEELVHEALRIHLQNLNRADEIATVKVFLTRRDSSTLLLKCKTKEGIKEEVTHLTTRYPEINEGVMYLINADGATTDRRGFCLVPGKYDSTAPTLEALLEDPQVRKYLAYPAASAVQR